MKQTNDRLELAEQYIQFTNRNLFLTGKAGTGKTTFLKSLKNLTPKRMVIVAPTGVAAINAGGVTIHSFFQLPFSPFIPNQEINKHPSFERKYSKEKIKTIRAIDLLIIDEISMVRADLLDAIDEVMRRYRDRHRAFGGVQLLMIGDLHQLAPVIKEDEWDLIKEYYPSIYFFESRALKQSQFITIELNKIYRQEDEIFINLLNKIRHRNLDQESIQILNSRYKPNFSPGENEEYITLTSHNHSAQSINQKKLLDLKGKNYTFNAEVQNEFPEHLHPNEYKLELKIGAQVMFVKNDAGKEKLYYNGKLGKITKIEEKNAAGAAIHIRGQGDEVDVIVIPVTWNNIRYELDEKKVMQEQIIGSFIQYPIKTAWAITIHKSQGLTFERAIIDAQSSFAHGQVYVALSRCKTLEGLVLSTPITLSSVKSDPFISTFNQETALQDLTEVSLTEARKQSQMTWIRELFEFKPVAKNIHYLVSEIDLHHSLLSDSTQSKATDIQSDCIREIITIADKFKDQLSHYFEHPGLPEENTSLQERIKKGSSYIYLKLNELVYKPLKSLDLDCDNKEIKKGLLKFHERCLKSVFEKLHLLKASEPGFDSIRYIQAKANAAIDADHEFLHQKDKPKEKSKSYIPHSSNIESGESGSEDQDLYNLIKDWRDQLAAQKGVASYMILPVKTIKQLSIKLPGNKTALGQINGLGKKKLDDYGDQILEIIRTYCIRKNLQSSETGDEKKQPVKLIKGSTMQISLHHFKEGKSIPEIASLRDLSISTIESHLTDFIFKGILHIEEVIQPEKIKIIKDYMLLHPSLTSKELKETFGDKYSYGEIRMVQASLALPK
ncbi:MAG: helix-turn-helix domain-containing protein [Saprospiraceae bacterium]